MTLLDTAFEKARGGSREAFAEWLVHAESPIRQSLRRFARAVDVEAVVQETLLRMWLFAQDRDHTLSGDDASLRFAIGLARNLARSEARRLGCERLLPPDVLSEASIDPQSPSDPGLRKAILACFEQLALKPLQALRARTQLGGRLTDRAIAEGVGMTLNTFLQNIVRARKQLAACLERRGVSVEESLS